MKLFNSEEVIYIVVFTCIIIFGAVVNATNQYNLRLKSQTEPFDLRNWIIALILASFSGLMGGLLATIYFDNQVIHWIAAGTSAFMGIEVMNVFGQVGLSFVKNLLKKYDTDN